MCVCAASCHWFRLLVCYVCACGSITCHSVLVCFVLCVVIIVCSMWAMCCVVQCCVCAVREWSSVPGCEAAGEWWEAAGAWASLVTNASAHQPSALSIVSVQVIIWAPLSGGGDTDPSPGNKQSAILKWGHSHMLVCSHVLLEKFVLELRMAKWYVLSEAHSQSTWSVLDWLNCFMVLVSHWDPLFQLFSSHFQMYLNSKYKLMVNLFSVQVLIVVAWKCIVEW